MLSREKLGICSINRHKPLRHSYLRENKKTAAASVARARRRTGGRAPPADVSWRHSTDCRIRQDPRDAERQHHPGSTRPDHVVRRSGVGGGRGGVARSAGEACRAAAYRMNGSDATTSGLKSKAAATRRCRRWWAAWVAPQPGQYRPVSLWKGQGGNKRDLTGLKANHAAAAATASRRGRGEVQDAAPRPAAAGGCCRGRL